MFRVYVRWKNQRVSDKTTTSQEDLAERAFTSLIKRKDLAGKPAIAVMSCDNRQVKAHEFTMASPPATRTQQRNTPMADNRTSSAFPFHPADPDLRHLSSIAIMAQAGRHLLIVGVAGSGKDITLNALLGLPEAKDYVTPAMLGFQGFSGPILAWPSRGCENDIVDLAHPISGYEAFRQEAARRFPNRPTACLAQGGLREAAGVLRARQENTIVVLLAPAAPPQTRLLGIRRLAEVLEGLQCGLSLEAAVTEILTPPTPANPRPRELADADAIWACLSETQRAALHAIADGRPFRPGYATMRVLLRKGIVYDGQAGALTELGYSIATKFLLGETPTR